MTQVRARAPETRSVDVQPPGPGRWQRETAHQVRPFGRFHRELFGACFDSAMRKALADYGSLLERLEMRQVGGWQYYRPRPVGAPQRPQPLPPALVFKLLLRLHPELRRRTRAASRALAERTWTHEVERWRGGLRDRFRAEIRGLQAVDPRSLEDAGVRAHLDEVLRVYRDGADVHYHHVVANLIAVGDFLDQVAKWTGAQPAAAVRALRSSGASVGALSLLDRLAATVGSEPAARAIVLHGGAAREGIARLRAASSAVAEALAEYLDEHGSELATGVDLDDRTVAELPETLMGALRARLEQPPGTDANQADSVAAALRARVPAAARAEYDRLLADARALYELREDDVRITELRPRGLLRRTLLEAGLQLAERGVVEEPEHLFESTEAEVRALLGGGGAAPTRAELAGRAHERRASALARPPAVLGPEEPPPPPFDWLPYPLARVNGAMMLALSMDVPEAGGMAAAGDHAELAGEVRGLAASAGRYQGRARIVFDPAGFGALQPGDVLIAPTTSPAYNVVLPLIGAVVTDRGGILSHAAIVAREYGIPAVVGTGSATTRIRDGTLVLVDGDAGIVRPA